MTKFFKYLLIAAMLLAFPLAMGCSDDNGAEGLGKKIDQAINPGPAQKAGKAIDKALDDAKKGFKDATK